LFFENYNILLTIRQFYFIVHIIVIIMIPPY